MRGTRGIVLLACISALILIGSLAIAGPPPRPGEGAPQAPGQQGPSASPAGGTAAATSPTFTTSAGGGLANSIGTPPVSPGVPGSGSAFAWNATLSYCPGSNGFPVSLTADFFRTQISYAYAVPTTETGTYFLRTAGDTIDTDFDIDALTVVADYAGFDRGSCYSARPRIMAGWLSFTKTLRESTGAVANWFERTNADYILLGIGGSTTYSLGLPGLGTGALKLNGVMGFAYPTKREVLYPTGILPGALTGTGETAGYWRVEGWFGVGDIVGVPINVDLGYVRWGMFSGATNTDLVAGALTSATNNWAIGYYTIKGGVKFSSIDGLINDIRVGGVSLASMF